MVLKKTSKEGFVFPRSENPKGAFLADFDIDGSSLKQDHKDWLDDNVVSPAKAKSHSSGGWQIELNGRASKSGSDAHNMWLSDQRIQAVANYLYKNLSGLPFTFVPRVLGESSPFDGDDYEHELDRSVEVTAKFMSVKPRKIIKPRLLIPKVHPWKRPVNRKVQDFKLKVLKAEISVTTLDVKLPFVRVGNGDFHVKMLIDIDETGTADRALYEFKGTMGRGMIVKPRPGFRPGAGFSTYHAMHGEGNSHPFATEVEMDAQDFAGPAMFRTDALGRVLEFGPKTGFFRTQEKIKNLSLGPSSDESPLKYAEGVVLGELKLVESWPAWAL